MIALVFPGQGSQHAGMGRELAENFPAARDVFAEADDALGFSLSSLCFNGPDEALQLTANTQPAMLATSIAAYRVLAPELKARGLSSAFVAGHSLGEYSALVAAGALTLTDAVRLVRLRGELMQQAVPVGVGAMAAILGLDADSVTQSCHAAAQGQVCSPANFNSPSQIVIAGHKEAVDRAMTECQQRGAKRAIALKVSAPFHCALMMPAQEGMTAPLNQATFSNLQIPLVNNVDAAIVHSGDEARTGVIRQISSPVRWTASVERIIAEGVDAFIEVGPGKVLCGLIKSVNRSVKLLNVENRESLESVFHS